MTIGHECKRSFPLPRRNFGRLSRTEFVRFYWFLVQSVLTDKAYLSDTAFYSGNRVVYVCTPSQYILFWRRHLQDPNIVSIIAAFVFT